MQQVTLSSCKSSLIDADAEALAKMEHSLKTVSDLPFGGDRLGLRAVWGFSLAVD
jgi:hypothetical protein